MLQNNKYIVEREKGIFGNPGAGHKMYYVSKNRVDKRIWHSADVAVTFDKQGRAVITFEFKDDAAKIIFFGLER